jgi:hypothetical protein
MKISAKISATPCEETNILFGETFSVGATYTVQLATLAHTFSERDNFLLVGVTRYAFQCSEVIKDWALIRKKCMD